MVVCGSFSLKSRRFALFKECEPDPTMAGLANVGQESEGKVSRPATVEAAEDRVLFGLDLGGSGFTLSVVKPDNTVDLVLSALANRKSPLLGTMRNVAERFPAALPIFQRVAQLPSYGQHYAHSSHPSNTSVLHLVSAQCLSETATGMSGMQQAPAQRPTHTIPSRISSG